MGKEGAVKRFGHGLPGALAVAALACAAQAWAQAAPDAPAQVVHVEGLSDPDEHAYRRLVKGMDAFEKYHDLAPAAQLRYRLYPRLPGVKAEGTTLTIQGDQVRLPLALAPDLGFTLPRDAQALDENARVVSNRKSRSFAWVPEVRTPGLAAHTRRLGDLRLQCEVDRAAGLLVGFKTPSYFILDAAVDVCTTYPGRWFDYGERAVFNVTLVHGKRRQALLSLDLYGNRARLYKVFYDFYPVLADRIYTVQISDTSWPDDTLIEIEYMDDPDPVGAAVPQAWAAR